MGRNVIFFAWNRSLPGRERISAEHFQDFSKFLEGQKQSGAIDAYDAVLLDSHGGDMNGFFLIRGDSAKLDALMSSGEWETHTVRGLLHLEGSGAIRGVTGDGVGKRMKLWTEHIPT